MTENTKPALALVDVWTLLSSAGIVLSKDQMESLQRYHDDLLYWNQRVNMISRKDVDQVWERHILHSLMILRYAEFPVRARVLDIGTGGGLPGIPLKIAREDIKLTMVDSIKKKVSMVRMFAEHTGLKDITVELARVEQLAENPKYSGGFDVIVSRAVAPLADLVSWSKPLLSARGQYVILKGGDLTEEIAQARHMFPRLSVVETPIDAFGMPWFKVDQKKVLTCKFS